MFGWRYRLFARSPDGPDTQTTAADNPFQGIDDTVVTKVEVIQIEMLAVCPQTVELEIRGVGLSEGGGGCVLVQEGGGCRGNKIHGGGSRAAWNSLVEMLDHLESGDTHQIGRGDVVLVLRTEKPPWRGVSLPPKHRRFRVCFDALRYCIGRDDIRHGQLRRDDAALVIDAHEETHDCVEYDPDCKEDPGAMQTNAAEKEGHTRDEEAWFLVREDGEEDSCREGREGASVAHP